MVYVVKNSSQTTTINIADGTVDNSTSIGLIGRNYLNYGIALNSDLLYLLENFANGSSPNNPVKGQLWYDTTANDLKVYNGSAFVLATKTVDGLTANNITLNGNMVTTSGNVTALQFVSTALQGQAPLSTNSTTQVANLNAAFASNLVNGNSSVIISANSNVTVSVAGNANVVTVTGTGANIAGYANITATANVGNLNSAGTLTVTGNANTGNLGTGTVIATIANLTTINSGLLKNGTSNVTVNSNGNVNISVGGNVLTITSTGANVAGTANITGNANVGNLGTGGAISATGNVSGGNLTTAGVLSVTGNANTGNLGTGTVIATTANLTTINSPIHQNGNSSVAITANANVTINVTTANSYTFSTGSILPNGNGTQNLGGTSNYFGILYGKASTAAYADLAEKYRSDEDYEPGTVLQIGGEHEVTLCDSPRSDRVFGCVSTDPAYLMNDKEGDGIWIPVVLTGRAPIRVLGIVSKGDRLVSAGNGAAMAAGIAGSSYQIEIGRALEDKTTDGIGLIEAYISTR
jgi:hypothetical protein